LIGWVTLKNQTGAGKLPAPVMNKITTDITGVSGAQ
jgi:hypothetical protein